jgi:signal transduction histidine kinase
MMSASSFSIRLSIFSGLIGLLICAVISSVIVFQFGELMPLATSLIETLVVSSMLIIVPLIVCVNVLASRYENSLQNFVQTIDMIEGLNDFSMQCEETGAGSILQLKRSFNQMLMRLRGLQQQFSELENELVAQKTKDMELRNLQIQQTLEKLNNAQQHLFQSHQAVTLGRFAIDSIQASDNIALTHFFEQFSMPCSVQLVVIDSPISELVQLFERAYKHRITFETDYALHEPVLCHVNEVMHVLLNLLTNAVQAIPHKGNIIITTAKVYNQAIISVADNGDGIQNEIVDKIFTPHFTTKKTDHALGLGLSINADIIQKHGGTLTVESKVNQGTRFIIALPFQGNLS